MKLLNDQRNFDNAVKDAKRQNWYTQQQHRLTINQKKQFWKKFGSVGISKKTQRKIPWEVQLEDGSISTNHNEVLTHWKSAYEQLLNENGDNPTHDPDTVTNDDRQLLPDRTVLDENRHLPDSTSLNTEITVNDIRSAIKQASKGKAIGHDGFPTEVLNNDSCVLYLAKLFNVYFQAGVIPESWSRGIINPIPKNPKDDSRNPLNYRGITITSSVYKLYCHMLNYRLSSWIENNSILCDGQDGFRKNRSTMDHISSLTYVFETRIKKKRDTFAAFIDFSKAYDRVDRTLLWGKLIKQGISGRMLEALKSLYNEVKCAVRINGQISD